MSFEDFAFDDVKPRQSLPEGEYPMEIVEWELVSPKTGNEEGKNLRIKFKLADPIQTDTKGKEGDFSDFRTNCQIWVAFGNPWAAISICAAVLGLNPEDEDIGKQIKAAGRSLGDKSDWLGEKVGVRLHLETNKETKKQYLKPQTDAFFSLTHRF